MPKARIPIVPDQREVESSDLFHLTAFPQIELESTLDAILARGMALASADVGAILVLEDPASHGHHTWWRHANGRCGPDRPAPTDDWRKAGATSFRISRRPGDAPEKVFATGQRPVLFDGADWFLAASLDLAHLHGRLQLEASGPRTYNPGQWRRLVRFVYETGIVLSRLLLKEHAQEAGHEVHFVGRSAGLLDLEERVKRIGTDPKSPVLIRGERGTGKELAAYALHYYSGRRHQTFLPVNSAAFSDTLFSDELFGHEKNAFTGARSNRAGLFGAADGGTVFFDEVGDMPPQIQAALLRVLDQGELRPLGQDRPLKVDVRVIGATNRNLEGMVEEGSFRADLYDRLSVFEVQIPPLRDRKEDIELLTTFFLRRSCLEIGRHSRGGVAASDSCEECLRRMTVTCAKPDLIERLTDYHFPGNIRELRNLVRRLSALVAEGDLRAEHASSHLADSPPVDREGDDLRLESVIKDHILRVLELTGRNKTQAARKLGLPLSTLVNKMKKLDIG